MEVVLCSVHRLPLEARTFLMDAEALLEPPPAALADALAVAPADVLSNVVHIQCDGDLAAEQGAYRRLVGSLIFRHPRTRRTAQLPFASDQMAVGDAMYAFTRVSFRGWAVGADALVYLSALEARIRMSTVPSRRITRQDVEYLAVPIAHLPPMADAVRDALGRLRCEFGVNVSFPTETRSTATFRSALVPTHHVAGCATAAPFVEAGVHSLWCLVHASTGVVLAAAEAAWRAEVGDAPIEGRPLDEFIARHATAAERARVRDEVLAHLDDLPREYGRIVDAIELAGPTGRRRHGLVAYVVGRVAAVYVLTAAAEMDAPCVS